MANESEKSECPVVGPIEKQLHEMLATYAAQLIVNKAESNLDEAVAHVSAHMLNWMVTALFEYHRRNPVIAAETLMGFLTTVAKEAGIEMRGGVMVKTPEEAAQLIVEMGKAAKETTH